LLQQSFVDSGAKAVVHGIEYSVYSKAARDADAYISTRADAGPRIREKAVEYKSLRNIAAANMTKEVVKSFAKPTVAALTAAKVAPQLALASGMLAMIKEEVIGFIDILGRPAPEPIPSPSQLDEKDSRTGKNAPSNEWQDYAGLDPIYGPSGAGMGTAPQPASSSLNADSPYRGVGFALAHMAQPERARDLVEKSPTPLHDTAWAIVREIERLNPGLNSMAYYVAGSVLEMDIHYRAHSLGFALSEARVLKIVGELATGQKSYWELQSEVLLEALQKRNGTLTSVLSVLAD
jgi:hypothetical protein